MQKIHALSTLIALLPVTTVAQWIQAPPGPADPSTIKSCTFWTLADGNSGKDCHQFAADWGVSWTDFTNWNPTVKDDCTGIISGNAYCIENNFGKPISTSTTLTSTTSMVSTPSTFSTLTSTSTSISTSTAPTGPVAPGPTQGAQDPNCNAWDYVNIGESCDIVRSRHPGLTFSDMLKWNPFIGQHCELLWAKTWVCVSVTGWTPSTTTTQAITTTPSGPTTTTPSNGIQTPSPIQPGMVGNCNKFYFINPGEFCDAIAKKNSVTIAQIILWNTGAGDKCTNLWAKTYACVGVMN